MRTVPTPTPTPAHDAASTSLAAGHSISLGHQLDTIMSMRPTSVLEIGVGSGVVARAIRHVGIPVTTLDPDTELDPDIVASVTSIPAEDGTWDVATCGQVLERLPFHCLGPALRELHRVTARGAVVSLPDVTRPMEFRLRLPRIGTRSLSGAFPFTRGRRIAVDRPETMDHSWEIGFAGTPLSAVTSVMAISGWRVARTWRIRELSWHRFFDLRHDPGTNV